MYRKLEWLQKSMDYIQFEVASYIDSYSECGSFHGKFLGTDINCVGGKMIDKDSTKCLWIVIIFVHHTFGKPSKAVTVKSMVDVCIGNGANVVELHKRKMRHEIIPNRKEKSWKFQDFYFWFGIMKLSYLTFEHLNLANLASILAI